MTEAQRLAAIGRLLGEPSRAAMLMTLMDGRAFTAAELARAAGVTPQTASAHLAQLLDAGLLQERRQGRHRFHALASPEVARLLEELLTAADRLTPPARPVVTGPRDPALRRARTCYDHFAGRLGVALADALIDREAVEVEDGSARVTAGGRVFLESLGICLDAAPNAARCRACLDWSERRTHFAGRLGSSICRHFFARDFVRRVPDSRAVELTAAGRRALLIDWGIREL